MAQLTQQYTTTTRRAPASNRGCGTSVFDLVKAFTAAYQMALKAAIRARTTSGGARSCRGHVRLAHYKGLDGSIASIATAMDPAQWRDFHELYEFARSRGWQREQWCRRRRLRQNRRVLEQEYLKTLLLMRLDSGNFTPDRWNGWRASRGLGPIAGSHAATLGRASSRRLTAPRIAAPRRPPPAGAPVPRYRTRVTRASSSGCGGCRARGGADEAGRSSGARATVAADAAGVAVRSEAIAQAPRAPRYATDGDVRVVVACRR